MTSVCIIHSDQKWCQQLGAILEEYSVFFVHPPLHDGEPVIDFIHRNQPNILVIDLLLPQVDGMYIISYIFKRMPEYRPFIYVLSSLGDDRTNFLLRNLPISYYSLRPICPDVVAENLYTFTCDDSGRGMAVGSDSAEPLFANGNRRGATLDELIDEKLELLGIPIQLVSTRSTHDAIKYAILCKGNYRSITDLYKKVCASSEHVDSHNAVERNLRTSIRFVKDKSTDLSRELFSDPALIKLTNSYFILKLSNHLMKVMHGGYGAD